MYTMIDRQGFADWLIGELKKRGWSQNDLAGKLGITRQAISNMISRQSIPSYETSWLIADVFKIPIEEVYRQAGLLPPVLPVNKQTEELNYLFSKLPDDEKEYLLDYMHIKLEMLEREGKIKP